MSIPSMVRFLAVGRLAKNKDGSFAEGQHVIVASAAVKDDQQVKNYKHHVKEIMNKGAAKLKHGRRIRLTSDTNDYDLHVMADLLDNKEDQMIVFFAVTSTDFGAAIARLLEEFKTTFYQNNTVDGIMKAKDKGDVHKASVSLLEGLIKRYGTNKIAEVQAKVDEVKVVMQENVSRTLANVEKLEDMESKAANVEHQAGVFNKNAGDLKSQMRCRYYKMTALIVLIVAIILTVIIVPIAIQAKK